MSAHLSSSCQDWAQLRVRSLSHVRHVRQILRRPEAGLVLLLTFVALLQTRARGATSGLRRLWRAGPGGQMFSSLLEEAGWVGRSRERLTLLHFPSVCRRRLRLRLLPEARAAVLSDLDLLQLLSGPLKPALKKARQAIVTGCWMETGAAAKTLTIERARACVCSSMQ